MADTLVSQIRASLAWQFQDALDLSTIADISRLDYSPTMTDGTGDSQADKLWHDQRTLAFGGLEDLSLAALPTTVFGGSVNIALAKVKAILIVNTATGTGSNLSVGGATSQEWLGPFAAAGDRLIVPPDSCLLLVNKKAGWLVSAGVAHRLRIANAGGVSLDYKIAILGTSA